MDMDRETLAPIFASRVRLAKMTPEEAVDQALLEHKRTLRWVASQSTKEGSFLWMCDYFDLEPDAVRRAIQEKK